MALTLPFPNAISVLSFVAVEADGRDAWCKCSKVAIAVKTWISTLPRSNYLPILMWSQSRLLAPFYDGYDIDQSGWSEWYGKYLVSRMVTHLSRTLKD